MKVIIRILATVLLIMAVWALSCFSADPAVAQDAAPQSVEASPEPPAQDQPPAEDELLVGDEPRAEDPALAQDPPADNAAALRDRGMSEALSGEFAQAIATLNEAAELAPDDPVVSAALDLLNDHQAMVLRGQAERATEYTDAVARVRRSMMVQSALEDLSEDDSYQRLREAVEELIDKYDTIARIDAMQGAEPEDANAIKAETIAALDDAVDIVARLGELLADQESDYALAFREANDELVGQLNMYREQWSQASFDSRIEIEVSSRRLRDFERHLIEAMTDVQVMVADEPWRLALSQASLARQLARPEDHLTEQDWYRQLIQDMEARGLAFIDQAEWEYALALYSGLETIDEDNTDYEEMTRIVGKHVRMLRYYGRIPITVSDADELDGADEYLEPIWREIVEGIDVDMVRTIVSRIDTYYVTEVEYAELIDEALTSLRVLAETPQAADSFEGLADDALRTAFLDEIDQTEAHFAQKDGPLDYLDLLLALNRVLDASERTVQIPASVLSMEFADGMLGALDTFSSAIWPNDVEQFRKLTRGHFTGVGIQVTKEPGEPLRVITPMAGTPAFRAGIRAGDLIVAVDGVETSSLTIDSVIDRIVGPEGTTVVLQIQRQGVVRPFDVPIVRDTINIRTIKGWRLNEDGEWDYLIDADGHIGYIRITRFTEQTAGDLDEALKELNQLGAESIILDFRRNPGGLLRQATRMANEFVPGGQIVMTQGRQVRRSRINADWMGDFLDGDLIILVDEYTASASEIVSGALKDLGRATVVGQRSFGKGSVQQVLNVSSPPNQALLKLTAAYYYVGPSERLVQRKNGATEWGVDPDIEIIMTPGQMRRWLNIRQRTDLLHDVSAATREQDLAAQLDADLQLTTGLTLLRLRHLYQPVEQAANAPGQ